MHREGGISHILLHCFFNGDGSVTHYKHDVFEELYYALPNQYVVLIADNSNDIPVFIGAVVLKTEKHHEDEDFIETLIGAAAVSEDLLRMVNGKTSFFPAKLSDLPGAPLTENEMMNIVAKQYMKHRGIEGIPRSNG